MALQPHRYYAPKATAALQRHRGRKVVGPQAKPATVAHLNCPGFRGGSVMWTEPKGLIVTATQNRTTSPCVQDGAA